MKRLRVHVSVDDLAASARFYSTLFATPPTIIKPDDLKWMRDDPRVNFAISVRSGKSGPDHLGIQVETQDELHEVYDRLKQADRPVLNEGATTCCYAQSAKLWITDPQGPSWRTSLTSGENTAYGDSADLGAIRVAEADPCCTPATPSSDACCAPKPAQAAACCGAVS